MNNDLSVFVDIASHRSCSCIECENTGIEISERGIVNFNKIICQISWLPAYDLIFRVIESHRVGRPMFIDDWEILVDLSDALIRVHLDSDTAREDSIDELDSLEDGPTFEADHLDLDLVQHVSEVIVV